MTPTPDLRALAEAVEKVEGPSRELDAMIGVAVGRFEQRPGKYSHIPFDYWEIHPDSETRTRPGHGGDQLVPRYTASIDAAMSLVPEGYEALLDWTARPNPCCELFFAPDDRDIERGAGAQMPLSVCAAALRARAATQAPKP